MGSPTFGGHTARLKVVAREGTRVAVADLLSLPGGWRLWHLLRRYLRRAVPRRRA